MDKFNTDDSHFLLLENVALADHGVKLCICHSLQSSPWESIFIVLGFVQLESMPKPSAVNGNLGKKALEMFYKSTVLTRIC